MSVHRRVLILSGLGVGLSATGCGGVGSEQSTETGVDIPNNQRIQVGPSVQLTQADYQIAAARPIAATTGYTLLATVVTETGSALEFYEGSPGEILLSESGSKDVLPSQLIDHRLSPDALYAKLSPGTPVPTAIIKAGAAAAAIAEQPAGEAGAVETTPPGALAVHSPSTGSTSVHAPTKKALDVSRPPDTGFCSSGWFYNNLAGVYCNGIGSFSWCYYDTTPGWEVQGWGLAVDQGAICVQDSTGNVRLTIGRSDSGSGDWSVPSWSWRSWDHMAGTNWLGNWNRYSLDINTPGTWANMQFAGFTQW